MIQSISVFSGPSSDSFMVVDEVRFLFLRWHSAAQNLGSVFVLCFIEIICIFFVSLTALLMKVIQGVKESLHIFYHSAL